MKLLLLIILLTGCTAQNVEGRLQNHKCLEFGAGRCICYWTDVGMGVSSQDVHHYTEMSCEAAEIAGFRIEAVRRGRSGAVE